MIFRLAFRASLATHVLFEASPKSKDLRSRPTLDKYLASPGNEDAARLNESKQNT